MIDYLALLERWNRAYNLTAVREPREMVPRHLLDCLSILPWLEGARLLDVGTGAGLPGLVVAVARPELACVLLDSSAKRTRFCIQAAAELGLDNVDVVRARVADHRDARSFDTVVSRAVASVGALLEQAGHLMAPGGVLLAMKGRAPAGELDALPAGTPTEVHALSVPGLDEPRHVVLVRRARCPGAGERRPEQGR